MLAYLDVFHCSRYVIWMFFTVSVMLLPCFHCERLLAYLDVFSLLTLCYLDVFHCERLLAYLDVFHCSRYVIWMFFTVGVMLFPCFHCERLLAYLDVFLLLTLCYLDVVTVNICHC